MRAGRRLLIVLYFPFRQTTPSALYPMKREQLERRTAASPSKSPHQRSAGLQTLTAFEQLDLLLNDTWRAWRGKLDNRLKPLGLSEGKWRTLVHLSKGGDYVSQSELAARMAIEQPTLAGLLQRLEIDGWIKRKSASYDRRCKTVRLAGKTTGFLDRISKTARELRHALIADIPLRDLQTCMRVLSAFVRKAALAASNGRNGAKAGPK